MRTMFYFLMAVVIMQIPLPSRGDEPKSLTVSQTVGMSFVTSQHGEESILGFASILNPSAKQPLRNLVNNEDIHPSHKAQVWEILSLIGDSDDVHLLEQSIQKTYREGSQPVYAALDAQRISYLGHFARRGIKEADKVINNMMDYEYWAKLKPKSQLKPADKPKREIKVPPGDFSQVSVETQFVTQAIFAYAYSLQPNLPAKLKMALEKTESANDRLWIEHYGDLPTLSAFQEAARSKKTAWPRTPEIYDFVFNGDLDQPEPMDLYSKKMAAEVWKAFLEFVKADEKDNTDSIIDRSLVDGEPLVIQHPELKLDRAGKRKVPRSNELLRSLEKKLSVTQKVLRDALNDHRMVFEPTQPILPKLDVRVAIRKGSDGVSRKEITARFPLHSNADDVSVRTGIDPFASKTPWKGKDNQVEVLMKRIDGVWYWSPFGW